MTAKNHHDLPSNSPPGTSQVNVETDRRGRNDDDTTHYDDEARPVFCQGETLWDQARIIITSEHPQNQILFASWLSQLVALSSYNVPSLAQVTNIPENYIEKVLTGHIAELPYEALSRGVVQNLASVIADDPEPIMFTYRACFPKDPIKKLDILATKGTPAENYGFFRVIRGLSHILKKLPHSELPRSSTTKGQTLTIALLLTVTLMLLYVIWILVFNNS
ncbi:MAG: hypothetical protein OXC40_06980 [Proteobacteria bacterium]|nr:hypothetical protein [Pseudomonadota bacterium]